MKDAARTKDFFADFGFTFNEDVGDGRSACLVVSDRAFVMLHTEPTFTQLTEAEVTDTSLLREVLIGLSADSRAEVDEVVEKAARRGGGAVGEPDDNGFMYSRAFLDPDGHQRASIYMDMSAVR